MVVLLLINETLLNKSLKSTLNNASENRALQKRSRPVLERSGPLPNTDQTNDSRQYIFSGEIAYFMLSH